MNADSPAIAPPDRDTDQDTGQDNNPDNGTGTLAGPGDQTHAADGGEDRIRCPVCGWTPRAEDRWMCHCQHSWNTFDTGGVCPGCLTQWKFTMCPACGLWSPHSDWYKKG